MAKIAVDFDGTIVEHEYPKIGKEIPFATETLRMLLAENHKLILWTVREGELLDEAIEWCRQRGVTFYAVNADHPDDDLDKGHHFTRKLKVDYFIDDRNIGGLPDWGQITASSTSISLTPTFYENKAVKGARRSIGGISEFLSS